MIKHNLKINDDNKKRTDEIYNSKANVGVNLKKRIITISALDRIVNPKKVPCP
jgi:uncharacterized protein YabE (DUF348 family)